MARKGGQSRVQGSSGLVVSKCKGQDVNNVGVPAWAQY